MRISQKPTDELYDKYKYSYYFQRVNVAWRFLFIKTVRFFVSAHKTLRYFIWSLLLLGNSSLLIQKLWELLKWLKRLVAGKVEWVVNSWYVPTIICNVVKLHWTPGQTSGVPQGSIPGPLSFIVLIITYYEDR